MLPMDEKIIAEIERRVPDGRSLVEQYQQLIAEHFMDNPLVPKSQDELKIQRERDQRIQQIWNIIKPPPPAAAPQP